MIVGNPDCRAAPRHAMGGVGYQCAEVDDPYAAMAEICRRPLVYRALVLSLNSLFREELALIETIKQRFGHIEIWLTDIDGRQAALAEALRLGADGLIADDGMHRIGGDRNPTPRAAPQPEPSPPPPVPQSNPQTITESPDIDNSDATGEPVLTADELRALLEDDDGMTNEE